MAMCRKFILSFVILSVCCLSNRSEARFLNQSAAGGGWGPARATWYGSPTGAGSVGGACGYKNLVSQPPYNSFVSAIGPSIYRNGQGCGECYQVKCDKSQNAACSGWPVTVVITDLCPGGPCVSDAVHFDLSGTAFGALAVRGQEAQLRNAGALQISYLRAPCRYGSTKVEFRVDQGSNRNYFAVAVEAEGGDGDLSGVALKQAGGNSAWQPMQHSWGALYKLDAPSGLHGPLSIRLTSGSGKTLEATNVIPAAWKPGATYTSSVNFA